MKYLFRLSLITILLLTITSCKKEEEEIPLEDQVFFKATINDADWVADDDTSNNTLIHYNTYGEELLQLTGIQNDIKLNIVITLSDITNCIPVGDYEFPNRVDIYYQTSPGVFVSSHNYDVNDDGTYDMTLSITACDGNKISGEFSGTYHTVGDTTPETVTITNGAFQNIEFSTIEY